MKLFSFCIAVILVLPIQAQEHKTSVSIVEDQFYINGRPTYQGRYWKGNKIEGLLFNSRMVQGVFDDSNPETVARFKYPDTKLWDPQRNTDEFVSAMKSWRDHGMLAFTLNLQGGSPMGYGNKEWQNSAFDNKGNLKNKYMNRVQQILDQADELGMVVILGYFYFGQDQYLDDESDVLNATYQSTKWILDKGYRNVIIEIANECNNKAYDQEILKTDRIDQLMRLVKNMKKDGNRLLVATSYNGNTLPTPNVVKESDFILIHGNGVKDPARISEMVAQTKQIEGYRTMPIVFNEDDHYDFEQENNNMVAAVKAYASWGFFDFRREGEGFNQGFQSVPVDWRINSARKQGFFDLVKEITAWNP
jgi:hypothetical protein